MIRKDAFVKAMDGLRVFNDKLDALSDAVRVLSPSFNYFWLDEPFSIVLDILEDIFDDRETAWLAYFVYELDFLKDFTLGSVTIDDELVDLSDWGKVYDFMVENMKNKDGAKDKEQ